VNRVCLVCFKAPERPMYRFENNRGISLYIHGHHRVLTIFKAGLELGITKRTRGRSRRSFVLQVAEVAGK